MDNASINLLGVRDDEGEQAYLIVIEGPLYIPPIGCHSREDAQRIYDALVVAASADDENRQERFDALDAVMTEAENAEIEYDRNRREAPRQS
jgi:hypothetical protein